MANDTFQQRYESRLEELRSQLFDSGAAQELLHRWVDVVTSRADDLVATDVIESDAAIVAAFLESQTSG